MRKKWLAKLLIVCLLFTMMPTMAFAEVGTASDGADSQTDAHYASVTKGEETKYYTTLAAAVAAAADGATVTLLKDQTGAGIKLIASAKKTVTIDLGGHTYTLNDSAVGSSNTESQGFHFEKGNTVTLKNGKITVAEGVTNTRTGIQNYCNLTLEGITFDGANLHQGSFNGVKFPQTATFTLLSYNGEVTLKDTTIKKTNNSETAYAVGCGWWPGANNTKNWYPDGTQITVGDGCTIDNVLIFRDDEKQNAGNDNAKSSIKIGDVTYAGNYTNANSPYYNEYKVEAGKLVPVLPTAELKYTEKADTGIVSDCIDKTMWVQFANSLPGNTWLWFDITAPNGTEYGIAAQAKAEGTTAKFAWSFLNNGQFEAWPDGAATGTTNGEYTVTCYVLPGNVDGNTKPEGAVAAWTKTVDVHDGNFTVTFNLGEGAEGTVAEQTNLTAGAAVNLPNGEGLSKAGYKFVGWAETSDATEALASYSIPAGATKDITLYAVWQQLSANADLSALTYKAAEAEAISVPEFSAEKTAYNVELSAGTDLTKVTVQQTTEDEKATASVAAMSDDHKIVVTVTAENGATKVYTISFTIKNTDEPKPPVEEKPTVEEKPAEPVVAPTVPENVDPAVKEELDTVSQAVANTKVEGTDDAVTVEETADGIKVGETSVSQNEINEAAAELNAQPTEAVKVVVVPRLDIKLTGATKENVPGDTTVVTEIKFDIELKADVKVTTEDTPAATDNETTKTVKTIDVPAEGKIIKITLPLPNTVVDLTKVGNVYVHHKKADNIFYNYLATKDVAKNTISFDNPNGFSEFTLRTSYTPKAMIDGNYYDFLQDAVNAVANNGKIYLISSDTASVGRVIQFTLADDKAESGAKATITANSGYVISKDTNAFGFGTYTVTKETYNGGGSSSGGGGGGSAKVEDTKKDDTKTETPKPAQDITPGKATMGNINTVFADVKSSSWFANAVVYVYNKGMMQGVADGQFGPNDKTTRGMIVTMLYRLEGEPGAGAAGFSDVASGQWYSSAVAWASANAVVKGYETGAFGPNDAITREQLAAILYRFAQFKGYSVEAKGDLSGFADSARVADWAQEAVQWAVGSGIINGTENNELAPGANATRAEVAAMLMRFCQQFEK